MANIRAEILAAGRSRKGWLDAKSQSLDQPFFKSIKSNFEDKTQESEKSIAKMKNDSLRPMGSKVSTIAHMFQSLSQQKVDCNLPRSPVHKDAPKVDINVTSDFNKYEKYPNAVHSPISPQSSTCSLSRRGSHLARFNNAKAMFEKLEGKFKHEKEILGTEKKSSHITQNKASCKASKNLISEKNQPDGILNVQVAAKISFKSSDLCSQMTPNHENDSYIKKGLLKEQEITQSHSKENIIHGKPFPLIRENHSSGYCSPYDNSRSSTSTLKTIDCKLSTIEQNERQSSEIGKIDELKTSDKIYSVSCLNSSNVSSENLLMCMKTSNDMCYMKEIGMYGDIAGESLADNEPNLYEKMDKNSLILGSPSCKSSRNDWLLTEECSAQEVNNDLLNNVMVEKVNISSDNYAHISLESSDTSVHEKSQCLTAQEVQCFMSPNLQSIKSTHIQDKMSNYSKSFETQSTYLDNECISCDETKTPNSVWEKDVLSYEKFAKVNHVADNANLSHSTSLLKEKSSHSTSMLTENLPEAQNNESFSEYVVHHERLVNKDAINKSSECGQVRQLEGLIEDEMHVVSECTCLSPVNEVGKSVDLSKNYNDIAVMEDFKCMKEEKDNIIENCAILGKVSCQTRWSSSERLLDTDFPQTFATHMNVTQMEPNFQIPVPMKREDVVVRDENLISMSTDDCGFRENSATHPSYIDCHKKEVNEYVAKDCSLSSSDIICKNDVTYVTEQNLESPPLPDPPSPCYVITNSRDLETNPSSYSMTSSPKWTDSVYSKSSFFPKLSGANHSTSASDGQNLYHAAGESLAECSEPDLEFLGNSLEVDDAGVNNLSPSNDLDLDYIEVMTQDEAEKLLSACNRHSLLSDEEAREVEILLSEKEDQYDEAIQQDISANLTEISVIHNGYEYHFLKDGHYYYENPGIEAVDSNVDISQKSKTNRVKFSSKPIKVYSTYSTEDYDRRNEEIDPISASAEYELEKRIEKMDVFPVDLFKGPEGLGLSIIGMGVGADAGVEKLGIFVKTVTEYGAADKDGRIKVNDQIIEVDGKSLVGVTQGYAASVLRNTAGHVRFLIGRDKEGASSEIAQLINQSLLADKEREAERQAMEQHYSDKSPWQRNNGIDPSSSTLDDELVGNLTYDVDSSGESASTDADVDSLRSKLKKAHYKNSVTDTELKKMKEKLHAVELMEHDYVKWLDVAQRQLEELSQNLQGAEQELLQSRHELEDMKIQCSTLEKKYTKAKKIIKEFQKREQELIQQEEFHIQQLQEKDQEYNALVKTLKDRIILLEQTLNDVQQKAGLPMELPYNTSLKQLTPQLRRVPERPKFLKVHCPEMSDSEASDGDMHLTFSPDDVDEDCSKRATVERKPLREELFDKAVPHTELLDTSAAKAKAELANKGSLANRQPPSAKKQTGSSSTDDSTPDNTFSYDIFIRPSDSNVNRCSSPLNMDPCNSVVHSVFMDFQFEESIDQQILSNSSHPLTLLEEMKVAVAARQARMSKGGHSDDPFENDDAFVNSPEKQPLPSDIVSQSSLDSSGYDASLSYSITSINEQTQSPDDSTTPTSDEASPPSVVHRTESNAAVNVEIRQSNLWLFEPTHEWTSGQVGDWLKSLGFEHHVTQFTEADVTGQILLQIDSSRLKALGVINSAERAVIKKKVKEMRSQLEKERRTQEKELKAREKQRKKAAAAAKK